MKKFVYFFFVKMAIHTNTDNCDRKSAEKMLKFVFYTILWKLELSGVGFVRLDSGREHNLSGSESDMYVVHARSKICPCVPPSTLLRFLREAAQKKTPERYIYSFSFFLFVAFSIAVVSDSALSLKIQGGALTARPWECEP